MGKSFRRGSTQRGQVDSKKDILDFLEEEHAQGEKKKSEPKTTKKKAPKAATPENDLPVQMPEGRHTFIIGTHYLDKLKDVVYTKRVGGQFAYSQREALHDALDMLFASIKIKKRPVEIRQKEEERSRKISAGRHSRL